MNELALVLFTRSHGFILYVVTHDANIKRFMEKKIYNSKEKEVEKEEDKTTS